LRFSFARLSQKKPVWINPSDDLTKRSVTLPVLERPRPTWSIPKPAIPTEDNKKKNKNENKNTDKEANEKSNVPINKYIERKVPGRKFYVHHSGYENILNGKQPVTGEAIEKTKNNRTVEPLNADNEFEFEIHFENLHPYELGLLILSIQLEKGLVHKLGMAKAYGFGSVDISVESVDLRESASNWKNANSDIDEWIQEGKDKLSKWFGEDWSKIKHIQDLKKLLCFHNEKPHVFYPPLEKTEGLDKPDGLNIPSYKDLKKSDKNSEELLNKRIEILTTPWHQISS